MRIQEYEKRVLRRLPMKTNRENGLYLKNDVGRRHSFGVFYFALFEG